MRSAQTAGCSDAGAGAGGGSGAGTGAECCRCPPSPHVTDNGCSSSDTATASRPVLTFFEFFAFHLVEKRK